MNFTLLRQRRVRGKFRRSAFRREFTSLGAVEVVKLALNGMSGFRQFMHRSAGVFGFTACELHIALLGRLFEYFLSLFESHRFFERVSIGGAHVVHADCRDGLHARVDRCRADNEASAAANPDGSDPLPIHEWPRAEEIHRGAESLDIDVRRDGVTRLAFALAPEGRVDGHGD